MTFIFRPRDKKATEAVVGWHYEEPYSFYDMEADEEDLVEFLDPACWENSYAVYDDQEELIGFFSFEKASDKVLEIGLGLRPDMTGHGIGLTFVKEGLAFGRERFAPKTFKLAVATFNERAIKVYEKAGFQREKIYMQETNGGRYEFLEMIKEIT